MTLAAKVAVQRRVRPATDRLLTWLDRLLALGSLRLRLAVAVLNRGGKCNRHGDRPSEPSARDRANGVGRYLPTPHWAGFNAYSGSLKFKKYLLGVGPTWFWYLLPAAFVP